jgi:hypothetical protein
VTRPAALAFALLALSLVFPWSWAAAQDADASLSETREMILYARYDEAVAAARRLVDAPSLTARQRNAALELLATAHIANGDESEAREVLARLHARDPGHRLSDQDASPQVVAFFARAREAAPRAVDVSLEHRVAPLAAREAPLVEVRASSGGDTIEEIRLAYRQGTEERFTRVLMTAGEDGVYRARIPVLTESGAAYDVSYFVEALAPSLTPLARLGSDAAPLELTVPSASAPTRGNGGLAAAPEGAGASDARPGGGSVLEEWWFWTLVALAVGGGVAAFVLLGPPSQGPEEGTLGGVTLGLSF